MSERTEKDHLRALGLGPDATWEDVKRAFRQNARTYHPDVAGPAGARKYAEITDAYYALKEIMARGGERGTEDVIVEKKVSLFKKLWSKISSLFRRKKRVEAPTVESESEYDYSMPTHKIRTIERIIAKSEEEIHELMSRRGEMKDKAETQAILSRVASKHPVVALLALKRVSPRDASPSLRQGIVEHFKKNIPASEVLECLLTVFAAPQYSIELARALSVHANDYAENDAAILARWFKRVNAPIECFVALLSHRSNKVAAAVLSQWPAGVGIAHLPQTHELIKRDDESVLVPLLRLLKKEDLPPEIENAVLFISKMETAASVKVWANAIVRERNLG